MRLNEYKDDLNNIKITPEFRKHMTELLSAEPDTEYADSVSHVEPARKIGMSRYAAIAASAIVAVGIGSAAIMNLGGKAPHDPNVPDDNKDNILPTIVQPTTDPDAEHAAAISAKCTVVGILNDYDDHTCVDECYLGELPQPVIVNTVFELLGSGYDKANTMTEPEDGDPLGQITIEFNGTSGLLDLDFVEDMPFTYTVDTNGYNVIKQGVTEKCFKLNIYDDIMKAIALHTPELDWTINGNPGVGGLFAAYAGQFKLQSPDEYSDEFETTALLVINDIFGVELSLDDEIRTSYYTSSGEKAEVRFTTPDGVAAKMRAAVFGEEDETAEPVTEDSPENGSETADVICNAMKNTNGELSYFITGGEDQRVVPITTITDYTALESAVKKINWSTEKPDFSSLDNESYMKFFGEITEDCFQIEHMVINKKGVIYDQRTQTKYIPATSADSLVNTLLDFVNSDDIVKMNYLIASSSYNYTTLSAYAIMDATFDLADPRADNSDYIHRLQHKVGGLGMMYHSNGSSSPVSEYIALTHENYTAEYVFGGGCFLLDEYGSAIRDIYPEDIITKDSNGNDLLRTTGERYIDYIPAIRYDYIKNTAEYALSDLYHGVNKTEYANIMGINVKTYAIDDRLKTEGFATAKIDFSDNYGTYSVDFMIDDKGIITFFGCDEKYTNDSHVSLMMDIRDNVVLDSPEFAFPQSAYDRMNEID